MRYNEPGKTSYQIGTTCRASSLSVFPSLFHNFVSSNSISALRRSELAVEWAMHETSEQGLCTEFCRFIFLNPVWEKDNDVSVWTSCHPELHRDLLHRSLTSHSNHWSGSIDEFAMPKSEGSVQGGRRDSLRLTHCLVIIIHFWCTCPVGPHCVVLDVRMEGQIVWAVAVGSIHSNGSWTPLVAARFAKTRWLLVACFAAGLSNVIFWLLLVFETPRVRRHWCTSRWTCRPECTIFQVDQLLQLWILGYLGPSSLSMMITMCLGNSGISWHHWAVLSASPRCLVCLWHTAARHRSPKH